MTFDDAFDRLMQHEGFHSDHPSDPGGATTWGVTEAVARLNGYEGDMRELPIDFARRIARRLYWDVVRADDLPPQLRFHVFDAAYNSGAHRAAKWLQELVGADVDGIVGPKTLAAVREHDPVALAARYNGRRLKYLTSLNTWTHFGKGWARRLAYNLEETA